MLPANERQRYNVATSSLIGWAHTCCCDMIAGKYTFFSQRVIIFFLNKSNPYFTLICIFNSNTLFTKWLHGWPSTQPEEQWARLCVFTLQGCVQAARLCRGHPWLPSNSNNYVRNVLQYKESLINIRHIWNLIQVRQSCHHLISTMGISYTDNKTFLYWNGSKSY